MPSEVLSFSLWKLHIPKDTPATFIINLPSTALKCWYFPRCKDILIPPLPWILDTPTQGFTYCSYCISPLGGAVCPHYEHWSDFLSTSLPRIRQLMRKNVMFNYWVVFEITLMLYTFPIDAFFLSAFSGIVDRRGVGVPKFYWTPPEHHLQYSSVWTDQCFRPGGWMDRKTWCVQYMRWWVMLCCTIGRNPSLKDDEPPDSVYPNYIPSCVFFFFF